MKYGNVNMGQMEAAINKMGGIEVFQALLRGQVEIVIKTIINWLGTVTVSATTEKFVAKEKFVENSKEVKFYVFSSNFSDWFLSGDGKVEEPIDEQELRHGKLTKGSIDEPIIEELGGEAKAETTLTEMLALLKKQANGEEGVLLTNGWANIFYIRDATGALRTVRVRWFDIGWHVFAFPVEYPIEWGADNQVVSRNY